ncbi:copper amine oxidase N-terminal domain-containing protein [Brevibacillus choshinensis]|uniref:Copper amine oxidase N-terminal domain-containing protein n=1 Tax=Brevibacillus choshinensis TaxID=54911 RepID=A0ABX7FU98_BRECH|nr:copper amine oxidase N-terminal domain-containing protein [Brevibacillus choshinensis]QRG69826.1 copper amine oxidase N-terminal domain-containing protein [Brevibacillus choshinensis]
MEKSKKALPIVLASALAATPLVAVPQQAHALSGVTVTADDNTAGEDSEYDIEFTTEEIIEEGDTIYVKFDKEFDVDKNIDEDSIDADFDIKSVKVNGNVIEIKVDEEIDEEEDVSFTITDGITNPDDEDTYEVAVQTTSEKGYESDDVKIKEDGKKSSSSSDDEFNVDLSSNKAGEKVSIELGDFDLDGKDELETGETITVIFPDEDMLPSSINKADVKVNGSTAKSVDVDGDEVTIDVPSGADGDDYINIEFLKTAGISNPDTADDYTFKVKYDGTTYESESFEIAKSGSSSSTVSGDYTINLSDPAAGARSSYTFETDFGKDLKADSDLVIEFPSADMVPMILSPNDFTVNGKTPKKVGALGNKVYITTPSNFTADSTVKVVVAYTAWITNPKTAGSYNLKATVANKTITSKAFTIGGSSVNPTTPTTPTNPTTPTPNPTGVNNSTATITLTNTAMNQATGVNVAIKGLGVGLAKQRDFIELVFPAGYRVPAYIAPANISVNGVAANYVAVRGQNVLVYPAQDIPAATAANVSITAAANIVNPAVKNAYSISVFTSEEKGLQFARAVGVGMPAPAQPVVTPPKPTTPTPPTTQPAVNVPTNAALFKVNAKTFTLHGKNYPLQVAPYLAGGNTTMVPAQFFKEALALTTQWNNQSVAIISGTKVLKFTVGSTKARIGNQEVTLPSPVVLKEGMPMIPVRFVTDNLGYKVGWDAKTSSVYVYR